MRGVPCGRDARRRRRPSPAAFSVPRATTPPVSHTLSTSAYSDSKQTVRKPTSRDFYLLKTIIRLFDYELFN